MKLPEIQDRLIANVAMADRSAFETIYDQSAGLLYAICLRILEDAPEAEDCVQSLFTQLWNRAEDLRAAPEPLMMQLVTAARAEAMSRRAGQNRDIEPIATRDLSPLQPNARPSTVEAQDGSLSGVLDQMPPARSTLMRRIILDGEGYVDLPAPPRSMSEQCAHLLHKRWQAFRRNSVRRNFRGRTLLQRARRLWGLETVAQARPSCSHSGTRRSRQ